MRVLKTKRFLRDFRNLPPQLQARMDEKLAFLARDLTHPSLRVKPFHSAPSVYEGRVNEQYRFLFTVESDAYLLLRIGPHDMLDTFSG
jgi:mRNA-degrading endonuclease RelE of RelBE toxin-antitoxin system